MSEIVRTDVPHLGDMVELWEMRKDIIEVFKFCELNLGERVTLFQAMQLQAIRCTIEDLGKKGGENGKG